MAVGLGLAATGGGRRGLAVAVPLVGAIVSYNTVFKDTAIGPVEHGGVPRPRRHDGCRAALARPCRPPRRWRCTRPASRRSRAARCTAARPSVALAGLAVTGATTIAAVSGGAHRPRARWPGRWPAAPPTRAPCCRASSRHSTTRRPRNVRTATRAGIGAMIPLQATLVARTGALAPRPCARGRRPPPPRARARGARAGDVT